MAVATVLSLPWCCSPQGYLCPLWLFFPGEHSRGPRSTGCGLGLVPALLPTAIVDLGKRRVCLHLFLLCKPKGLCEIVWEGSPWPCWFWASQDQVFCSPSSLVSVTPKVTAGFPKPVATRFAPTCSALSRPVFPAVYQLPCKSGWLTHLDEQVRHFRRTECKSILPTDNY